MIDGKNKIHIRNSERIERSSSRSLKPGDYRTIIDAMVDTAWIIDLNGRIIDMNESAIALLGYSREELREIGLSGIDDSLSNKQIMSLIESMPRDKKQVFETSHRTKIGKKIPVEICSSLVQINGNEVILSIARDITERKWAQEKITRQLEEKETLLRAIHHKVKNSIASVESFLSIQARSVDNKEAKSIIQDAIGRVSCVRILYETMLKAQNYSELSLKTFLLSVLEKIVELYSLETKIDLTTEMEDFQISQRFLFPLAVIFEELLTNAYKYAFAGNSSGKIEVKLRKEAEGMILEISDSGRGLPEYFSIDDSNGFGLRIVKMLCNEIDAELSYESGYGTHFRITLEALD